MKYSQLFSKSCLILIICFIFYMISNDALSQSWTQLFPTGSVPTTRYRHTAVYDTTNNRMIIFGGSSGMVLNDVWVLSNANGLGGIPTWTEITTTGSSPTNRTSHTAVYDEINNRMIIFGGTTTGTYFNDVWFLSNANGLGGTPVWTQLTTTGSNPTTRYGHTAVYDPSNNRMTIFGGTNGLKFNDVWVLSNANGLGGTPAWTELTTTGSTPTTRHGHTAIYDVNNNRMTIFGGLTTPPNPNELNDVWVMSHANGLGGTPTWSQLSTINNFPTIIADHSAIYDTTYNRMTIFGGQTSGVNLVNDVWVLKNANGLGGTPSWLQLFPTGSVPTSRELHSAVYDATYNRMIIFGGYGLNNDVWVLNNAIGLPPPSLQGNVIYSDINKNSTVDSGDKLTLQFDNRIVVNGATASDFFIPVTGDSLGTGATVSVNPQNDTQVIITLGTTPTLTITSTFNIGTTTSGAPSGIDISATITPDAIEDLFGNDAIDGGVQGVDDNAYDIRYDLIGVTTSVSAFSAATVQVSQDTINAYYTEHKLILPAGSLGVTTTITISVPGDNHGELSAVSFGPSSLTFSTTTPAVLVIEYKEADTKQEAGYLATSMRVHQYSTTQQKYIPIPESHGVQSVDTVNKTTSVPIIGFDVFNQDTIVPYANISLPTVDSRSYPVGPATKYQGPQTNLTLTVGTGGIYTQHQLEIPDYQITVSGFTITLTQATLEEKQNWGNNAVLKIIAYGEPTTNEILTMEYKDYDHPQKQFTNDVIGGTEDQMRIYRWRSDINNWEKVSGTQSVNTILNLVTATVTDALTTSQIYVVGVETLTSIDSWEKYALPDIAPKARLPVSKPEQFAILHEKQEYP